MPSRFHDAAKIQYTASPVWTLMTTAVDRAAVGNRRPLTNCKGIRTMSKAAGRICRSVFNRCYCVRRVWACWSPGNCGYTTEAEADMSQRTFSLIAGVVFGLIALGHVLRIVFGWSFVVQDFSVPMWASGLGVVVMAYLAYQAFGLARKSSPGV